MAIDVLHYHRTWLRPSENWIHTQVSNLPSYVRPAVVCYDTENERMFGCSRLFARAGMSSMTKAVITLSALPRLGFRYGTTAAMLSWAAARTGARIVHSHFGFSGADCATGLHRRKLRHVVSFYGIDGTTLPSTSPRLRKKYRDMFGVVDAVLCEGPHMAKTIVALGCPAAKVRVHHLGVPVGSLSYRPRTRAAGEQLRVLIAGGFREKKGITYALEAVARIREHVDVEVTLIGDAGDNPLWQQERVRIHQTLDRYRMRSYVRELGWQSHDDLIGHAYRNHIFLSPSVTAANGDTEGGSPVIITEMAATGMPVVSTRHADIPEVIEDGVTGLLADERDIGGLAERLLHLAQHPELWESMGHAARSRVEAEYNSVTQGTRLAEIYRSLS